MTISYSIVTPARDEAENLRRLVDCLDRQIAPPMEWIVVENGSSDGTPGVVESLASERPWIRLVQIAGTATAERGRPIVRALHAGIAETRDTEIVVVLDADVSFDESFFATLVHEFAADPLLGIASGAGLESRGGRWQKRHLTGSTVWGATRAFRRGCLEQVLPFDELVGWDGIDEFKANAAGWTTRVVHDAPFRHHRREGERDGARWRTRVEQGRFAWYVGYRPYYVLLRSLFNSFRDPGAFGIAAGFLSSWFKRIPQIDSPSVRAYVRRQQELRRLPSRAAEALGLRLP